MAVMSPGEMTPTVVAPLVDGYPAGSGAAFGVYVHVPFCSRRCDYCAFATWTDRHHLMADYAGACRAEIDHAVADGMPAATSVFFGGGTPSLLPAPLLVSILDAVPRRVGCEVSVECNPDNVDLNLLSAYRDAGVTRLSFGVQSMVPGVLSALGRDHDPAAARAAVTAAGAAGFADAYSVDLIYGAAGETLADWRATLASVVRLDPVPTHVSAYALTVEPGTPLARDRSRYPDGDDQADKYALADDILGAAGLGWYEISNWAKPGAACAHNRLYWEQGEYRGIGCAAHSHELCPSGGSRRWWNVRTPDRYIRLVGAGASAEAAGEELDADARRFEALTLGLRTSAGVHVGDVDPDGLADLIAGGLIHRSEDRAVLTLRGRLLANEVVLRLAL
jgi:putative oxygen-independent coproporphyrinogen III oxidase